MKIEPNARARRERGGGDGRAGRAVAVERAHDGVAARQNAAVAEAFEQRGRRRKPRRPRVAARVGGAREAGARVGQTAAPFAPRQPGAGLEGGGKTGRADAEIAGEIAGARGGRLVEARPGAAEIGAQPRDQPGRREGGEAPALFRQRATALFEGGARLMAFERGGGAGEAALLRGEAVAAERVDPLDRPVEALGGRRKKRLGGRQAAAELGEVAPGLRAGPPQRLQRALAKAGDAHQQLAAHRHGAFGGGGGRGGAQVGDMVDQRPVGLVADGGDHRDRAVGDGAHHRLLVEAPEVFQRAAAARHDQQVGPRDFSARRQRVEAADGGGDLVGRGFALHPHRPDQHMTGKAIGQAVENVADDGAGRRGDDADDGGQIRQRALARLIEQALLGEGLTALFEQRHQGAEAGELNLLDDDLVGGFARERRQLAGRDNLDALLRARLHARENALPDHCVEPGALVLQAEIAMAGGMGPAIARHLAAHAHQPEPVLDRALQRARQFGHRKGREIGEIGVGHAPL